MKFSLFTSIKWVLALAAVAAILGGVVFVRNRNAAQEAAADGEQLQSPRRVQNNVVKLGAQLAESYGIADAPAKAAEWRPRIKVYGRVIPNPRATAEVRAPLAGTLRPDSGGAWPTLGSRVKAGQVLAWLDVRVGPEVRLDFVTKLQEARAKLAGSEEVVRIQKERLARLEAAAGSVSRADLDAAHVQETEARTQLATVTASVKQWAEALAEIDRQGGRRDATWSQPLKASADGEVTDLVGGPGVAVEPGGVIVRVVDFRRALVRLDLPLSSLAGGPPREVELSVDLSTTPAVGGDLEQVNSHATSSAVATLVGAAPQVDAASQSAGCWYEVDVGAIEGRFRDAESKMVAALWRPGLFVTAEVVPPASKPRPAVAVPETALLYHQGRALVYVRVAPGRFERREVQILGRERDSLLLAAGVAAGESVVSRRAQVLLSEEFRGEADND